MEQVRFRMAGDTAVTVEFGNEISPAVNARVRAFGLALEEARISGIVETVPTYRSLMVHYDPGVIRYEQLEERLRQLSGGLDRRALPPGQVLEIPVLYGGEEGPDLDFVAQHAGLSPQEVIRRHCAPEYLIYMLGFTPGFVYLGGMDESIITPRLAAPRVKIPAGSVGIAGSQTGVYPLDSPGGWQLIGRTPVKLYDPDRERPILPEAGEYIQFYPVSREEYREISAKIEAGTWECRRRTREEGAQ